MIDGMTFGVAAGAAYAASETIVATGGCSRPSARSTRPTRALDLADRHRDDGEAADLRRGHRHGGGELLRAGAGDDGFKPAYFRGLAEALVANILFQGGLFFAARLEGTTGAVVGVVWGALIAAALVVRLRYLLHFAVLEAALEASSQGHRSSRTQRAGRRTAPPVRCRCSRRRTSVSPAVRRSAPAARSPGPATGPTTWLPHPRPSLGAHPRRRCSLQDNKKTALVVGGVVAAILARRGHRPGGCRGGRGPRPTT